MAKPSLGERQGALLRYIADHPGLSTNGIIVESGSVSTVRELDRRLSRLCQLGLIRWQSRARADFVWHLADAGREWLATRANPVIVPPAPRRLVIGRKMRACVAYVAKHEGCTKYAAGKAVTASGHARDGWVIVQRCIDAGLLSQRKRRDGMTALSVTERGWVS